ncbi:MAG TPA: 3-deoxy-7-phosphoheptulonate synthase [Anaerohalosphaeraceae bacterium]|nr:3-deoxy-7-phosphoheptulonate synthase [Anaerohalosphaeraceae bacterium]HOM76586.1 3-deoxy-7-phosphoheptulonate synthase [Anaerohalosphaeraceae bacterium]HPC64572.1 3-deoxy-7-phosphoheptulonate synthase [Anaerohalosphaeraceae bacterium]HPO70492.1 3-deoxy-7-phosphoheptulonate synthase [Anaerohalosphaeraceae bacterium]HRS71635.1 3-deoxy-7-phosphoheptulonate synthase [Anaerohalosphaeraceae bacterium]
MIIVMKPGATKEQIQHVIALVNDYGLKEHPIYGTDRTVIACLGDKRAVNKDAIENAPMVEKIVPILSPYKMASLEVKKERTQIPIGPKGFPIGGPAVGIIAGPCSVEDRRQIMTTAQAVRQAGCIGLRGGAYKPRTSPYSFQGLGLEGLKILAEAREETGLAIVTEVIGLEQLEPVAQYSDVLQIGARNMQHYPLLEAVGKVQKPVLLKRGMSASIDEFLLAAEYIINAGNPNVILCERGIRTFEEYVRNTLPLAIIPALRERTHLPVIVDPSHGTGHAYMVPPMCLAAIAAGADGLIVECHPDPEHAASDGAQSITPQTLSQLMPKLRRVAEAVDRTL